MTLSRDSPAPGWARLPGRGGATLGGVCGGRVVGGLRMLERRSVRVGSHGERHPSNRDDLGWDLAGGHRHAGFGGHRCGRRLIERVIAGLGRGESAAKSTFPTDSGGGLTLVVDGVAPEGQALPPDAVPGLRASVVSLDDQTLIELSWLAVRSKTRWRAKIPRRVPAIVERCGCRIAGILHNDRRRRRRSWVNWRQSWQRPCSWPIQPARQ